MTSIDTIVLDAMNALQALNRTCTLANGKPVYAPTVDKYPTVLDTPNLPFAMTWPGDGEAYQKGDGYDQSEMTYRVIVYVQALGQDDIPTRTVDAALLLQQMWNLYCKAGNTPQAAPPPYQLTIQSGPTGPRIRHGGVVSSLRFAGANYLGFEFSVPVRAIWNQ